MMVLTAARPKGRQAAVLLTYEKTDISEEIAPDLESFKYTDVAESQSDSVSITVNARAAKWKNDWMPEKGVKLYPAIVVKDWNIGALRAATEITAPSAGHSCWMILVLPVHLIR